MNKHIFKESDVISKKNIHTISKILFWLNNATLGLILFIWHFKISWEKEIFRYDIFLYYKEQTGTIFNSYTILACIFTSIFLLTYFVMHATEHYTLHIKK